MRKALIPLVLASLAGFLPAAIPAEASPLSLSFSPTFQYPLGPNAAIFAPGGRGNVGLEFQPGSLPALTFLGGLGYALDPYDVRDSGSLSALSAELGAAWRLPLGGSFGARLGAKGGFAWGFENGSGASQGIGNGVGFAVAEAAAGLDWAVAPSISLRLDASYRYELGLTGFAGLGLGLAWRLPKAGGPAAAPRLLELKDLKFGSVFPVFRSWYDENPIGKVVVVNTGKKAAKDVKLTFLMRQYMDAPKLCATIPSIEPKRSIELPLYALFNESILGVTETTKASAEIKAEYLEGEAAGLAAATESVTVRDRNAMTWDDDRKAAAFVSGKDPWVLVLSNQVANDTKPLRNPGIDKNLQLGLAFHEALRLYGIAYASSPTTPFAAVKANPETVDFLKYPRQTLAYKAGDCADLSILYASMLESVGVPTAFITVPGHILMAFALSASPEQAAKLSCAADLAIRDGAAWLPFEATMRDADFSGAWAEGAKQWRESSAAGAAAFYPIHAAWETYPPAGLPADASAVVVPETARVAKAFQSALALVAERELAFRLAGVEKAIAQNGATPKSLNDRGIVYAAFGKLDLGIADFRAAQAAGAYLPALVNLGNVLLLKGDAQAAADAYRRASLAAPGNARILANLAKACALMGDSAGATAAIERAKALDPAIAAQVAPSLAAAQPGTRAAEAEAGGGLYWIQE